MLAVGAMTLRPRRENAAPERRSSPRLSAQVEVFLQGVDILPFAPPDDFTYARIRVELERAGTIIGANDLVLAAQAVAHD